MATLTMLMSISCTKVAVMMMASIRATLVLSTRAWRVARRAARCSVRSFGPDTTSARPRDERPHRFVHRVEDVVLPDPLQQVAARQVVGHLSHGAGEREGDVRCVE